MVFRSILLAAVAISLLGVANVARADHLGGGQQRRGRPHGMASHRSPSHRGHGQRGGFHKGFRGGSISGPNFGHHSRFRDHLSGHVGLRHSPYNHFGSFAGFYGGSYGSSGYGGFVGPRYYGSTAARRFRARRVSRAYVIEREPISRPTPWRLEIKMARQGLAGYHAAREGEERVTQLPGIQSSGVVESGAVGADSVEPRAPLPTPDGQGIEAPRTESPSPNGSWPSLNGKKADIRRGAILYPDSGEFVRADELRPKSAGVSATITAGRVRAATNRAISPEPLGQSPIRSATTMTSARKRGTPSWRTVRSKTVH